MANIYDDLEKQARGLIEVKEWLRSIERYFISHPYKQGVTEENLKAETVRFLNFLVQGNYVSYRAMKDLKIYVEANVQMATAGYAPMGLSLAVETSEMTRRGILPFLTQQINRNFYPDYL